jgi:uncharacterized LabA/DUF88 family protein
LEETFIRLSIYLLIAMETKIKKFKFGYDFKIGVFTDFPNIDIGIQNNSELKEFNISLIYSFANFYGNISKFNIYGDWNRLPHARDHLKQNYSFSKLILVPHLINGNGTKKDLVDTQMTFDIAQTLIKNPDINLYIIVSGDADFIPVIHEIRKRQIKIIVISEQNSLSSYLTRKNIKIITYQELEKIFLI